MERNYEVGAHVIYVDPRGQRRDAIVTVWWGNFGGGTQPNVGCNLVFVADDETKKDPYGRQIERATSVCHKAAQPAPGNYWCWPDE